MFGFYYLSLRSKFENLTRCRFCNAPKSESAPHHVLVVMRSNRSHSNFNFIFNFFCKYTIPFVVLVIVKEARCLHFSMELNMCVRACMHTSVCQSFKSRFCTLFLAEFTPHRDPDLSTPFTNRTTNKFENVFRSLAHFSFSWWLHNSSTYNFSALHSFPRARPYWLVFVVVLNFFRYTYTHFMC